MDFGMVQFLLAQINTVDDFICLDAIVIDEGKSIIGKDKHAPLRAPTVTASRNFKKDT